jgi:hypothetical protein
VNVLLDRATAYVGTFVNKFSHVVAEETYGQEYVPTGVPVGPAGAPVQESPRISERRQLKSDLLLVRPNGFDGWQMFRDVFEVNKSVVRDRGDRLTALFLKAGDTASALEQATQIMTESARFNVRPMGTVDNPLLAFTFLQFPIRNRFRFVERGFDRAVGQNVQIVAFLETVKPTLNRTALGGDIFAQGRYWIGPRGEVLRTEINFLAVRTASSVTTNFKTDDRFGVAVPVEMRILWKAGTDEIRGTATYGAFREFRVNTSESIHGQP